MKNTFRVLVMMMAVMLWMSCSDDEPTPQSGTGNIEMALKVTYDGQPLVLTQNYDYPDGKAMYFSRFSFYMSNLSLKTDGGTAISESSNYLRVGQAHNTTLAAAEGYKFNLNDIQPGDFTSINFEVGVPADDNAMEPTDFTSDNDLSLSGEYWGGWESYVFCKVEGVIDFDGDGIPESDFALHLGGDEALRNIEIAKAFSVTANQTTEVVLPIELRNFFTGGDTIYDIESDPKLHSLSQNPQMLQLANNLDSCF